MALPNNLETNDIELWFECEAESLECTETAKIEPHNLTEIGTPICSEHGIEMVYAGFIIL